MYKQIFIWINPLHISRHCVLTEIYWRLIRLGKTNIIKKLFKKCHKFSLQGHLIDSVHSTLLLVVIIAVNCQLCSKRVNHCDIATLITQGWFSSDTAPRSAPSMSAFSLHMAFTYLKVIVKIRQSRFVWWTSSHFARYRVIYHLLPGSKKLL